MTDHLITILLIYCIFRHNYVIIRPLLSTVGVEDIKLTVPKSMILDVSANVTWAIPNHKLFAKSTCTLSLRRKVAVTWLVDGVKRLHLKSDRGCTVFEKLRPNTEYYAQLTINPFPERPRPVTKKSHPFRTQGQCSY